MIKPTLPIPALVCCLLLPVGAALAQTDETAGADDKPRLQEKVRLLHEEADTVRQTAEARHAAAQKTCWDKFLVSACLADAGKALRDDKSKAYLLDRQAREIERDIRKRDFAEREAKRLEQAPTPADPAQ